MSSSIGWRQIIDLVTNYLTSLNDNSAEIIHSII